MNVKLLKSSVDNRIRKGDPYIHVDRHNNDLRSHLAKYILVGGMKVDGSTVCLHIGQGWGPYRPYLGMTGQGWNRNI